MSSFSTSQEINSEFCDNQIGSDNVIGKILKTMRKQNNLSQEKIALLTNIGRSTISDYEREKTDINFENIERIAKQCGYEVIFRNKKTGQILTTENIERKEI